MIELVRIVENQSTLSSYKATQNEERAVQLELLIEMTKPANQWHCHASVLLAGMTGSSSDFAL